MTADPATTPQTRLDPEVSGKLVILVLFLFGSIMTGTMWVYWKMHLAPFLPLQQAIVAEEEFKLSRPVVEGGREKGDPDADNVLRVTMMVEFDPNEETERVDEIEAAIVNLARTKLPQVAEYDLLELNLYWPKQESELTPITTQRRVELHAPSL